MKIKRPTVKQPCLCGCGAMVYWSWKRGHNPSGKHGMSNTSEYTAWQNMKNRCLSEKHPQWKDWGGRGITVCPEWLDSFEAFYAHIGRKPSSQHTLERIDNDGNYEPGNVRWATMKEQGQNRRTTKNRAK